MDKLVVANGEGYSVTIPATAWWVLTETGRDGKIIGRTGAGKVILLDGAEGLTPGLTLLEAEPVDKGRFCVGNVVCVRVDYTDGYGEALSVARSFQAASRQEAEPLFVDACHAAAAEAVKAHLVRAEERRKEHEAHEAAEAARKAKEAEEDAQALTQGGNLGLALVHALRGADWYYSYSDDGRVWSEGEAAEKRRGALYDEIVKESGVEVARQIWNMVAPSASQIK